VAHIIILVARRFKVTVANHLGRMLFSQQDNPEYCISFQTPLAGRSGGD
jgi:hypothetical protein